MHVCPSCGGIWFEAKELNDVLSQGVSALDALVSFEPVESHALRPLSKFTCPNCAIALHRNNLMEVQEIPLNTCYQCAGIYMQASAVVRLDQIFRGAPQAPHTVTPEEQKAEAAVENAVFDDTARTAALFRFLYGGRNEQGHRMADYLRSAGL